MRNFTRTLLMLAVDISVDKANGERLDIVSHAGLQRFAQRGFIKSRDNAAICSDTFTSTNSQLERCQKRLLNKGHPAAQATGAKRASHLQGVFETRGCNEAYLGAASCQNRIRGNGGSVHHQFNIGRVYP